MSRRRKLGRVTRDRWFESGSLQQRVRTIGSATISRAMLGIRMPRPSRATSHHPAQNAPAAIRTPSRASAFVLRRISPLPRVRAKVRSQSDLPTLVIVHLKPVVC